MEKLDTVLEEARSLPPQTYPPEKASKSSRGIPLGREGDTFESFDLKKAPEMQEAYDQCQQVSRRQAWCAFLLGPTGNGKTHLAIAALQASERGMFWKVPDFLAFLRSRIEVGDVDQVVGEYQESEPLLVLDDLGVEKQTEWAFEQLYRILDRRCDAQLPTIITSNQDREDIDGRLRSRFRVGYVACAGKDQR